MTKLIRVTMMALALMLVSSPTFAQPEEEPAGAAAQPGTPGGSAQQSTPSTPLVSLVAVGAGLVILGAGFGIGRIGGQAVEAMSRQPEASGSIQTAMIISAALIEGATFFALIVCLIA